MSTTYVAVGIRDESEDHPVERVVLAVSRDKAKLEAFAKGLRVFTQNLLRPGGPPWPTHYVHAGQTFQHVVVEGPVTDLDGPHVVVAGTVVGTINM